MNADDKAFRNALGAFATGVTVVTTTNGAGKPIGMTANSFSSLSLTPPLILWNVGDHSDAYQSFVDAEKFCVHVLHSGQQELSNHFATKSDDKFRDIEWKIGEHGSPLLADYAARYECIKEANYPGGDHIILVGRVLKYDDRLEKEPLG